MKKGDKIVTMDGIIGTLHGIINTREISLEIYENVRIRVMRDAIANVSKKETNSKGSSFSVR
jgi:preprotein translocase subunit YajC